MKEPLRAKLERTAKDRGVSLNAEAVNRLERTFENEAADDRVLASVHEQFGGKGRYHMFRLISEVVALVEEKTEQPWLLDPETFNEAKYAILAIVEKLGPDAPAQSGLDYLRTVETGEPATRGIGKEVAERRLKMLVGTDWPNEPPKTPE